MQALVKRATPPLRHAVVVNLKKSSVLPSTWQVTMQATRLAPCFPWMAAGTDTASGSKRMPACPNAPVTDQEIKRRSRLRLRPASR